MAPNELDRDFTATAVNEKWVTDVTFVRTDEGWLYLASMIDLFNREVVGWAMGESNDTVLTLNALDMALEFHNPPVGLIHHSDRGSNYTAKDYREALSNRGIECSMSRKGNCWDNAVAESFFATIKKELIHPAILTPDVRRRRQYSSTSLRSTTEFAYTRCLVTPVPLNSGKPHLRPSIRHNRCPPNRKSTCCSNAAVQPPESRYPRFGTTGQADIRGCRITSMD